MGIELTPAQVPGVAVVPVGTIEGLPVGLQIVCAPWREDLCLRVAAVLERMGIAKFNPPKESPQ